jgi:hypothetical protein
MVIQLMAFNHVGPLYENHISGNSPLGGNL